MPLMVRSISSGTRVRSAGSKVRTVPAMYAEPGITLNVVPAMNWVTDTTTGSSGSTARETMCCSAATTCAPTRMGSTVSWGAAAWPPFPMIVHWKLSGAAIAGPAMRPMEPYGIVDHRCRPMTASTPSITPARHQLLRAARRRAPRRAGR